MFSIGHSNRPAWDSYHETRPLKNVDLYHYNSGPNPHPDGPMRFAATAAVLAGHLAALTGTAPAGTVGTAWSLNDMVGHAGPPPRVLELDELDFVTWVEQPHLHNRSRLKPGEAVFVGGGTTWAGLVKTIEAASPPRSILTCGSYLDQTIAGSIATSTAGSRLGHGATQNQVIGMHLVTAPNESVWIERASDPVLGHVAATFATRIIRDDAAFEDALVHLGGMGLINGLIVETVPRDLFNTTRTVKAVDQQWLSWIRDGDFTAIARWLGCAGTPVYYEVQVDPFDLFATPALHSIYFAATGPLDLDLESAPAPQHLRLYDALAALDTRPDSAAFMAAFDAGAKTAAAGLGCDLGGALVNLFDFYASCFFQPVLRAPPQSWGQIHQKGPEPGFKGNAFSAAFAVPRGMIDRALPALCGAAQGRDRHFLYTLRFVSNPAGTLAVPFTGEESVVVDFEGVKVAAVPAIEVETNESLSRAHAALDAVGIPYHIHWGKLGSATPAKVEKDYGPSNNPKSPLGRWRATRTLLLGANPHPALRNDALIRWGLA